MENNQIEKFETIPNSFLTEVTENEFMSEMKKIDEPSVTDSTINVEVKKEYAFDDIEAPLNSEPSMMSQGQSVGINNFLNEELGTELYDAIVTAIAMTALNAFGIESTKSEMSFTAKEKNVLKPIIKECIDTMNIKFTNPFEALAWTTLLLVGTKIMSTKGEQIAEKFKAKSSLKKVIKKEGEKKPLSKYMQKKLENEKNKTDKR
jgi:hypothetical protein